MPHSLVWRFAKTALIAPAGSPPPSLAHKEPRRFHRVTRGSESQDLFVPLLHALGNDSEQIRPALPGVEIAGGAFDAGVKFARSFRLRRAMQSAHHAPIRDCWIFGRGPIVRGPIEAHGRGRNDDVADLGFADQAAARSHANEDPGAALHRLRQHNADRRPAHARRGHRDVDIAILAGVRNQPAGVI